MEFTKTDNPEPITVNGVEVIPDESYDVDVDEDGPFIVPDEAKKDALKDISDSGSSIIGGDTGTDADYNIGLSGVDYYVPTITVIEDGEDIYLEMMGGELAGEKMVEMAYENEIEPEVYS